VPFNGTPQYYDRVPAEDLVSLSLSQLVLRQVHIRALTFLAIFLAATAPAAVLNGELSLFIAGIAAISAGMASLLAPTSRLTEKSQSVLDALRQVPTTARFTINERWIPAERIEAGMWVCRRGDHKAAAVTHRRQHGRSAGEPKATYRLIVAFTRYSGSQMIVAFGDGTTEFWNPQSHVSALDGPEVRHRDSVAGSARALNHTITNLARQPNRSIEYVRLISGVPNHLASCEEVDVALRAAQKWCLIDVQGDERQSYQLTEAGRLIHGPCVVSGMR
jgi:hypothetical protein